MARLFDKYPAVALEVLFQVLLHVVLFLFFSFDKDNPGIEAHQIAFFINYALGALVINYFLLPWFYYRKKYLLFILSVVLLISAVISVEELIIERIYFPDTRGKGFPGVIYSLLDVMPMIMILSGFKFAWDASKKQHEVEELRASVKESELQFLKSQINPHFLFNNLNNLYSYAMEGSPKTPSIILELSSVLRYMLYDCKEDYVPLEKEIAHLKDYTKLYELQIEERGTVTFRAGNMPVGYEIAPLILMVFIENAFKHSTASQTSNIKIAVELQVSPDGILTFNCKNSFENTANTEDIPHGIGLQNVKKRLGLLYPRAHDLYIHESDNWYIVDLSIRLKK